MEFIELKVIIIENGAKTVFMQKKITGEAYGNHMP